MARRIRRGPARAQRVPYRNLSSVPGEAGQREAGQVGTGHEKHDTHEPEQHPHERPGRPGHVLVKGPDSGPPPGHHLGEQRLQSGRDRVELGVGTLRRGARGQSPDPVPLMGRPVLALADVREPEVPPHLDRRVGEPELGPHHSHHLIAHIVQRDGGAQHVGIAAVPGLPEPPGQEREPGSTTSSLLLAERPAQHRGHPQGAEGRRGHGHGAHPLGPSILVGQGHPHGEAVHAQLLEGRRFVPPVDVGGGRQGVALGPTLFRLMDGDDSVRLVESQGPEHHGVGDAEDSRAGADGQGEGPHGHGQEARGRLQAGHRRPEVAPHFVHPATQAALAFRSTRAREEIAPGGEEPRQLPPGPHPSFIRVHPGGDEVVDPLVQVEADLGVQILRCLTGHVLRNAELPLPLHDPAPLSSRPRARTSART